MTIVRTVSFTAGPALEVQAMRSMDCHGAHNTLWLEWPDGLVLYDSPSAICQAGLKALDYTSSYSGVGKSEVTFKITLIPPGAGFMARSSSINLLGPALAWYIKPVIGTPAQAVARMQARLAHESVHIATVFNRQSQEETQNEDIAYLAGYCATLDALGLIDEATFPRVAWTQESGFPDSVIDSSQAGIRMADVFRGRMDDDLLHADSEQGEAMLTYCDESIGKFFGTSNPLGG